MLSCSHPGHQGPKSKKCIQEEEAAHDDDAESREESSVQARGVPLARSINRGKVGPGDQLPPSPKSSLSQQSPRMAAPDKKKNDWLLVCGKIPGTTKGHM